MRGGSNILHDSEQRPGALHQERHCDDEDAMSRYDSYRYEQASKVLAALNADVQPARPKYYESTVLACQSCGHRFGIVHEHTAKQIAAQNSACKCGGRVKIIGYHARLQPRRKAI